jgi:hypothetical protein
MIIEAPEQQVAVLGADAIRSQMGRMSNTPPARIFVYQTRTINGAGGQPNTAVRGLSCPRVLANELLHVPCDSYSGVTCDVHTYIPA